MPRLQSRIGFGLLPFGAGPFGFGDYGKLTIWDVIPDFYKSADLEDPNLPLRNFVDAIIASVNELRLSVEHFDDLRDVDNIDIEFLDRLSNDIDWETNQNSTDAFRRSTTHLAPRFYLLKGTDDGYRVAGEYIGFSIIVEQINEDPCESENLTTQEPTSWVPLFDVLPIDTVPLDSVFGDFYDLFPYPLEPLPHVCRTHRLNVLFTSPFGLPDPSVVSQVLRAALSVKPIHVTFEDFAFFQAMEVEVPPVVVSMTTNVTAVPPVYYGGDYDKIPADVMAADFPRPIVRMA